MEWVWELAPVGYQDFRIERQGMCTLILSLAMYTATDVMLMVCSVYGGRY